MSEGVNRAQVGEWEDSEYVNMGVIDLENNLRV